jgi:RNA ligase
MANLPLIDQGLFMVARQIRFPSIEQYRNVVHNVTSRARYVGKDANGDPVYDQNRTLPTLKFQGTVKLHGTNAGIACDAHGNVWCQSRENIITPQADNAGFAMFVHKYQLYFDSLFAEARNVKVLGDNHTMLIFGEWCGAGIQKKVALTQFPKMFVVFGVARVDGQGEKEWFTGDEIRIMFDRAEDQTGYGLTNLYHTYQFPTYEIEIDFNRPHEAQNRLVELTIAVEQECPVARQLGASAEKGNVITQTEDGTITFTPPGGNPTPTHTTVFAPVFKSLRALGRTGTLSILLD